MDLLHNMKWINRFIKLFNKGNKMEYLYKYTPHNNDSRKYEIITKSQLWFSKVESFNDPIDSKLDYKQKYTRAEIEEYWKSFLKNNPQHPQTITQILDNWGDNTPFVEQQNRVFEMYRGELGVHCFSKNPENILMWSHYANNHKGIVYEFKVDLFKSTNSLTNSFNGNHYKVNYPKDKSYELLSYTKIGKERNDQFATELLTKAKDWEYEEEYRMIDFEKSGNKTFKKDSLVSIIFGVRTSDIEIDIMKCLCKKYGLSHIQFKKAKFKEGKFEIEIIDI